MESEALIFLIAAFCLQVAAGAAGATQECETPGAFSGGSSSVLAVCTASGHWLTVAPAGEGGLSRLQPRATPDCSSTPGQLKCDTTCSLAGVCLSSGQWLQTQNCTATNGLVCREGICTDDDTTPCTPDEEAFCYVAGNFPSLTDCSTYFNCTSANTNGSPIYCDGETFYDACTGVCDVEASADCKWSISNPCTAPGTIGVAPNNDRLYYICQYNAQGDEIVPWWGKCATGHFNTTSLTCDNGDVPGCGPVSRGGTKTST